MNKNTTISLIVDNVALSVKAFGTFAMFALLLLLSGCDNDKVTDADTDTDDSPAPNVTMTLKAGTDPVFMKNASIYVFTDDDKYVGWKPNVKVNLIDNILSTNMPVGTWNLALLTCDVSLAGNAIASPYVGRIIPPAVGGNSNSPMWETGKYTDQAKQFLSQTPAELRFDSIKNAAISEGLVTKKQATLHRNVAKIQVILDYSAFDAITPANKNLAYAELLDVPTTLNWRGEYLPDKDHPYNSGDVPIREYFNFKEKIVDGVMKLVADPVDFIVPAHRGVDAFEAVHQDITAHKLRLRLSMPLNDQSYFGKSDPPITISYVPKINRIIQLNVKFTGEADTKLDVKVTVKDWDSEIIEQEEEF